MLFDFFDEDAVGFCDLTVAIREQWEIAPMLLDELLVAVDAVG
jgi:hypothetical protein